MNVGERKFVGLMDGETVNDAELDDVICGGKAPPGHCAGTAQGKHEPSDPEQKVEPATVEA